MGSGADTSSLLPQIGGGEALHEAVYRELSRRFLTGKIIPGLLLSTRGLAQELGVSQMPVREALSRLAADGAVEIRSKRRILVPVMTPPRFQDLLRCRLALEPEAAAQACAHMDRARIARLKMIDERLNKAVRQGDVHGYMESNHAFHFAIYEAGEQPTLTHLIGILWLQVGPFMRLVFGRLGTANLLVDQHVMALEALERGDSESVRAAMAADIADGMALIARAGFPTMDDARGL